MNATLRLPAPKVLSKDQWPPDYVSVYAWRQQQVLAMRNNAALAYGAIEYYRTRPVEFICHWVDTYDPRKTGEGSLKRMPMVLFDRQADLVRFFHSLILGQTDGLVEKCRDMGATWIACAFSFWAWRFMDGASIGWGSRKSDLVDKIGDPDSIFEKIRMIVRGMPQVFLPKDFSLDKHTSYMKMVNPETDATITGESGDNIGRGGRKMIYFKDESAHYERPELIEAALGDNTRTQVDISSVNGIGNVFHRRREAGVVWSGGSIEKGKTNVFIMDWRDHPEKNQAWYDARKAKFESEGLAHVFAQEVDRDYAASVTGTIIPLEWINSAIDAHIKLDIDAGSRRWAGLDVADGDETGDRNALAIRRGILLEDLDEWGDRDTGVTTRRAVTACQRGTELQYDSIGVGSGVKAEANRLSEEGLLPAGVTLVSWCASASVLEPDARLVEDDDQSPLNKDFYANLKAQGWWQLRLRFERTHRRITEGVQYRNDELISLSSNLKHLHQLKKELAQVTKKQSTGNLKLVVEKTPPGTRSPNLADAVMMAFWPIPVDSYTLDNL